jgi:DNA-directed RNA polymerase subunit beta'
LDEKGRIIDTYVAPTGAIIGHDDGAMVKAGEVLCKWDPHNVPIVSELAGQVRYEDLIEGKTVKVQEDKRRNTRRSQVTEHKGDLHPQIVIEDKNGEVLALYPIPERAYLEIEDGMKVGAGQIIAKTAREAAGTQDITGGLPRVTELFEARRPKEAAILAEIDGEVRLGDKKRGKRTIVVEAKTADGDIIEGKEHAVPQGKHLQVHTGDEVMAGEALVEGPLDPHDLLRIRGDEEALKYLLDEIQNVYRAQGVGIDDKHIEIILSQMTRKIEVSESGDSEFLPGQTIDKFRFQASNKKLRQQKKMPAVGRTMLQGVTKASLSADSFISAASFQETTKVLTEAAIAGKRDYLVGLKENVILGHMVPTGTGFRDHYRTRVKKNIDFGEIGGGSGFAPAQMDAEMESLLSGVLEDEPQREATLAATGSDGPAPIIEPTPIAEPETATEAPEA